MPEMLTMPTTPNRGAQPGCSTSCLPPLQSPGQDPGNHISVNRYEAIAELTGLPSPGSGSR
jgi:hypothetical protein